MNSLFGLKYSRCVSTNLILKRFGRLFLEHRYNLKKKEKKVKRIESLGIVSSNYSCPPHLYKNRQIDELVCPLLGFCR